MITQIVYNIAMVFNRKVSLETLAASFTPEVERAFQEHYYAKNLPLLRAAIMVFIGVSVLCTGMFVFEPGRDVLLSYHYAAACAGAAISNWLLLRCVLRREYSELWQPLVVACSMWTALIAVTKLFLDDPGAITLAIGLAVLIVGALRLQPRWLIVLHLGLVAMEGVALLLADRWPGLFYWIGPMVLYAALPQFFTQRYVAGERADFAGRYRLASERDDERRQREQTEKMLHILSQAIGGIVHDLGNPLTVVQSGAQTLRDFVQAGDADKELVLEFTEIITDGAQMLNYLRLSLMEQTRVLEGKPIPVERKMVPLRPIIEAGARYQKPKFSSGRAVVLKGDEIEVCVDDVKMITVLMNLIGNALKYSDGEVEINWRVEGDRFFVAILDQGRAGCGISQAQAAQLFVPFGRLDTHAAIEGTGLGLLSVQKIVEAHDGTIHIEGFSDGTAHSTPFQTAPFAAVTSLTPNFRTAFVIACPLQRAPVAPSAVAPSAPEQPAATPTSQATMLLDDTARPVLISK